MGRADSIRVKSCACARRTGSYDAPDRERGYDNMDCKRQNIIKIQQHPPQYDFE